VHGGWLGVGLALLLVGMLIFIGVLIGGSVLGLMMLAAGGACLLCGWRCVVLRYERASGRLVFNRYFLRFFPLGHESLFLPVSLRVVDLGLGADSDGDRRGIQWGVAALEDDKPNILVRGCANYVAAQQRLQSLQRWLEALPLSRLTSSSIQ
jgi:hypothetical protein